MSGGVAWVYDVDGLFASRANPELVSLEPLAGSGDEAEVRALVQRHLDVTGSSRAAEVLATWASSVARFVRVIPNDYRRVLSAQARMRASGLDAEAAEMAAFEENARDLARAGGG